MTVIWPGVRPGIRSAITPSIQSPPTAGISFVGAFDGLPAPAVAYSGARRLLTSYVANKAINVRRASDNATLDVGFLANGDLDAGTLATFLNATTGFIAVWYDQSGNGIDISQATAANQPSCLVSGNINGKPTVKFVNTSSTVLDRVATANPVLNGNSTVAAVNRPQVLGGGILQKDNTYNWSAPAGKDRAGIPSVAASAADSTVARAINTNYINIMVRSGGVSPWAIDFYQNGAANGSTTLTGNGSASNVFHVGTVVGAGSIAKEIPELLVWESALSAPNIAAVFAAMNAYYGVF